MTHITCAEYKSYKLKKMEMTFNFKIKIKDNEVTTSLDMSEGTAGVDINLLMQIVRIMNDSQKRVKANMDKFFGNEQNTVNSNNNAGNNSEIPASNENGAPLEETIKETDEIYC